MNKVCQTNEYPDLQEDQVYSDDENNEFHLDTSVNLCTNINTSRRVSTKQSPYLKVFHNHHPLHVTLDSGAEISMIICSQSNRCCIQKSSQSALQADGVIPLHILGKTHVFLSTTITYSN